MATTHAYLSAKVWADDHYVLRHGRAKPVFVKAHTFSALSGGWRFDAIVRAVEPQRMDAWSIVRTRALLVEEACTMACEVSEEVYRGFANLSALVALAHGDFYPTWVGNLYVQPVFVTRGRIGKRHLDHYLVVEAPDLDCGHWEEDPLPLGGG